MPLLMNYLFGHAGYCALQCNIAAKVEMSLEKLQKVATAAIEPKYKIVGSSGRTLWKLFKKTSCFQSIMLVR